MNSTSVLKPLLAGCLLLALSACGDEPTTGRASSPAAETLVARQASPPVPRPGGVQPAAASPAPPKGAPQYGPCAQMAGGVELCSDHSGPRFALWWTTDGGASWSAKSFHGEPLLWGPATSLQPRLLAAVGGGDGATLIPFEAALRSDDLGETWQRIELPRFDGEMAYVAGSVVTSDGRLLSLLNAFSDDALDGEADRPHGLYASDGSDWSSASPIDPTFTPALNPSPPGEPALHVLSATLGSMPSIRVQTWDGRVYASTDDALTFQEIAAG